MSKGRISERLRKRLNEGTMTPPSNPIETVSEVRLDDEIEGLIELVPTLRQRNALRSRIRHLVSEARKESAEANRVRELIAAREYVGDKNLDGKLP